MSIQEVDVTLEELQSLDQDEILRLCKRPVYYELESAFGSIEGSEAAKLLSATCSMHLKPENPKAPFSPKFIMQDRRGLIANDFSKESLNSLSQFCSFVTIPELKARLADISWVTKAGSVEHAHCSGQLILATVLESWYLTSDSFGAKPAL